MMFRPPHLTKDPQRLGPRGEHFLQDISFDLRQRPLDLLEPQPQQQGIDFFSSPQDVRETNRHVLRSRGIQREGLHPTPPPHRPGSIELIEDPTAHRRRPKPTEFFLRQRPTMGLPDLPQGGQPLLEQIFAGQEGMRRDRPTTDNPLGPGPHQSDIALKGKTR